MKKVLLLSIVALLSISACTTPTDVSNTTTDTTVNGSNEQPTGDMPQDMGPGGNFGLPANLNLTAEQTTQIQQLRQNNVPPQMDATKVEQIKKLISDAFVADTFDVASLNTKISEVNTQDSGYYTNEANVIISTYNILTDEQKQTLEASGQSVFNNPPGNNLMINLGADNTLEKITTDLKLDANQQESLKTLIQPAQPVDPMTGDSGLQATQLAVNAELKTGNATAEKIADILKTSAVSSERQNSELQRLSQIYNALNVDQRKLFVSMIDVSSGMGGPGGMPPGGDLAAPPAPPAN